MSTDTLARAFEGCWRDLADVGRHPDGGYERLVYTDAELQLREWFQAQLAARGLSSHEDRAGNLWGWWGDPTDGDAIAVGSHLDSVRQGGAYDGPLGVTAALLAFDLLRERGVTPTRPVAIAAFADEEGARFGLACAGSRLLTGQLAADRALALRDDDGISLADALRSTGRDPRGLGADPEVLSRIGAFVELHIEQGRDLVERDAAVAIGSAIRPHGRWRFDLAGQPNHAGTTLLADRDDPMLAAASLVLAARHAATELAGDDPTAVATVARLRVEPNTVNAIAGRVQAWLDARAEDATTVRTLVERVADASQVTPREESWTPRVDLDPALAARVARVVRRRHANAPMLSTGAGHDAGILASAGVPTAMLHVRNPTGISHAPAEHAEREDCLSGIVALADVLEDLVTSADR